jgi:hypothetical protein
MKDQRARPKARVYRLPDTPVTMTYVAAVDNDDFGAGWAGLVALGIFIVALVLIYFVWAFYQLVVLGAT